MARELGFDFGHGAVAAILDLPAGAEWLYVLAHGAGAGMRHPFMEAVAERLATQGVGTFRYQFPYMESGRKRPDRAPVAQAAVRGAVLAAAEAAPGVALVAGGKSFGGRMTSQAAAEEPLPGVHGLAFLGFPLHAAGRPSVDRAAHLADVTLPMLFLQGTRDALADLELLRPVCERLSAATIHVVEDGDHSFKVPKRSGRTHEEALDEVADAIARWTNGLARRLVALGLLTLAASACADGARQAVLVRDSAGVTIVESAAPAWDAGEGWRVAPSPSLDIGVVDGAPEYQLDDVADVTRLGDGRILVADGGSGELRRFDADGRFLGSVGGLGDGPGEFSLMNAIGRAGDSTWVYDYFHRRITVFPDDGGAPRIVTLHTDIPNLVAAGRLPDGRWVLAENWATRAVAPPPVGAGATERTGPPTAEPPREGLRRDPVAYVRFGPDGGDGVTIGMFPGREMELRIEGSGPGEGRMMMINVPFARTHSFALAGGRLLIGDQVKMEIGEYGGDGALRRLIRVPDLDLTLTESQVQAALSHELEEVPERARPGIRALWEGYTMPATRPAYGRLIVDADGNLWAGAYARFTGSESSWTVFDGDGRLLGTVDVPARFRVYHIDDAGVLGVWRDALDVEHVRLYPLLK